MYHSLADAREQVRAIVFAFTTAEVWSVDTYWLEAYRDEQGNPTISSSQEQAFRNALVGYSKFLQALGINSPFKWIAGMEGLRGRLLYLPSPPGRVRWRLGQQANAQPM